MPPIITAARIGQRRMPNATRPAVPSPASARSGGTAAITKITMLRNTIAPNVSARALPRLTTKLLGSSCS